jgi:phage repressor protein C with HTH and peptisase S24 domain
MQITKDDIDNSYFIPDFKGADFMIRVKGDSMYPRYNSGDIVACKKLNIRDIFFQWNKVYILDTEQGAILKRISKANDQDKVLVVSDNEAYAPFELKLSQIHGVAIVVGVIRPE